MKSSFVVDESYPERFKIDQKILYKTVIKDGKCDNFEKQANVIELTKALIKTPEILIDFGLIPLLVDYMDSK